MAIRQIHYAVFDFETTDKDINTCQPIEIACRIYNGRSLEPIPEAEFVELCKPTSDCIINQEALDISKISRKEIDSAFSIEIIYPKFCEFLRKYNIEGNKFTAPISCGHNIKNFDLPIHYRMMQQFVAKGNKKTESLAFSTVRAVDLMDIAMYWFENTNDVQSDSLNSLRQYFGIKTGGAHRALKDVNDCGLILMRFLKFHRELAKIYVPKMKNSCKTE